MNRFFSWRLSYPCLVAGASLCVLEGVSSAREPAFPVQTQREATAPERGDPALVPGVHLATSDAAHAAPPPGSPSGTVASSERLAVVQAVARALAGMAACHISHHPLDGLRASEHACPLLFADAGKTLEGVATDRAGEVLAAVERRPVFYVF